MSALIPEGSVVITPTEMYREMLATHQAVRDVAGKLDGALGEQGRRLDEIDGKDGRLADHEVRIRGLERWRWTVTPVVGALSAGIGAAVAKAVGH